MRRYVIPSVFRLEGLRAMCLIHFVDILRKKVRPVSLDVIECFSVDISHIVGMRSPAAIVATCKSSCLFLVCVEFTY